MELKMVSNSHVMKFDIILIDRVKNDDKISGNKIGHAK